MLHRHKEEGDSGLETGAHGIDADSSTATAEPENLKKPRCPSQMFRLALCSTVLKFVSKAKLGTRCKRPHELLSILAL